MRGYLQYFTAALLLFLTGCASISQPRVPPLPERDPHFKAPGHRAWSQSGAALSGSPLVQGDLIYTTDVAHHLNAYDRLSGKRLWRKSYAAWDFSTGPVAAADQVVVGTQNGQVVALDGQDGAVRWAQTVSSEVLAAPLLHGDSVYVHTIDGAVFALDAADGHARWATHHANPALVLHSNSRPVAEKQHVWVGMPDGHLLSLDAESGAVRWDKVVTAPEGRTDVQRMVDIAATPLLDAGVLYVLSYQGQLSALSAQTGHLLWQYAAAGYQEMRLDGKAIYLTNSAGQVLAVERAQGQLLWRQEALGTRLTTGPVLSGDYVLVGDRGGYVHWLSKADGACRYYHKMVRGPVQTILSTPDQILVSGSRGSLVAFNLKL